MSRVTGFSDLPDEVISDIVLSTGDFKQVVIMHSACKGVGAALVSTGKADEVARLASAYTGNCERERRQRFDHNLELYYVRLMKYLQDKDTYVDECYEEVIRDNPDASYQYSAAVRIVSDATRRFDLDHRAPVAPVWHWAFLVHVKLQRGIPGFLIPAPTSQHAAGDSRRQSDYFLYPEHAQSLFSILGLSPDQRFMISDCSPECLND
jgi:hypothetical protein